MVDGDTEGEYVSLEELERVQFESHTVNGWRYQIRRIGPAEYLALGGSADLEYFTAFKERQEAAEAAGEPEPELPDQKTVDSLEFADRILVAGLRSHKLVQGEEEAERGVSLHVNDFPDEDKQPLLKLILTLAGVTLKEAEKLDPTSEDATPS